MVAPLDIIGQRFGKLVAIHRCGSNRRGRAIWRLQCDCGSKITRCVDGLRRAAKPSCGCFKPGSLNKGRAPASKTHGMSLTRIYSVWQNMRWRCHDPNNYRFRDYGGRGIKVCDEWQRFEPFMAWAHSNGYRDDLQIDRIDNDAGYRPENCRFVTPAENMRNQRTTIRYVVGGESVSLPELAERYDLRSATIRHRIENIGMTPDEAVSVRRLPCGARKKAETR